VKGWLGRAAAGTTARGEHGSKVVRWTHWYGRRGPVPDDRFQGLDEPFPGHWRRSPKPWPDGVEVDPRVPNVLDHALDDLPATWRTVARRHTGPPQPGSDAADDLGLSPDQERNLVNEARAALRRRLAEFLGRGDPW
jgi:RNA polymerase sigma-70 factor (ECF subfamily)